MAKNRMALKKKAEQVLAQKVEPMAETPEQGEAWAFPTKSRCPRCKSLNTHRITHRDGVQYRECKMAICRHRYTVRGARA